MQTALQRKPLSGASNGLCRAETKAPGSSGSPASRQQPALGMGPGTRLNSLSLQPRVQMPWHYSNAMGTTCLSPSHLATHILGQPPLEPTDHLEQKQLEEQLSSLGWNVPASLSSWQDEPGQGQAVT